MPSDSTDAPSGVLTYAIGDIHGCLDKLNRLIDLCRHHAGDAPMRLIFVGDYIDRGPDSRGVIEALRKLQTEMPDVICLRGNHEALLLEAAHTGNVGHWLLNGGIQTLVSYGISDIADMPREHLDWIAARPLSFDDGRRLFVHAGVDPHRPLDRQIEYDLLWIREPFLSSNQDYGRLVVHGHTPLSDDRPDLHRNRLNLDTGAVYGGPLSAAVFRAKKTLPVAFFNDRQSS